MTHSDPFLPAKFGNYQSPFSNDYLLKHGNFFMKPPVPPDGYAFPHFNGMAAYSSCNEVKVEVPDNDVPLNFTIKQEKPPTPPSSPIDVVSSTQTGNGGSSKNNWVFGKQKLSWDNSTVASYNPDTKMFRCVVCNAVGFLSRIAEHYLGTHTSAKVFQCLHCPYSSTWSRCVRMHMAKHHGVPNAPPSLWKGQPLLEEIFQLLTNLKTNVDSQGRERLETEISDKKFVCPKCPYTTDRRDLYLRHENIHKEDKPYHCYICFKLFNRADHVKKHFLRIHRGHPYDISLVRRRPPRVASSTVSSNSSSMTTINNQSGSSNFSVDKLISSTTDIKTGNDIAHHDLSNSEVTITRPKTFQCPLCQWEGVDSWCLRRHMNIHTKSFECPLCNFKGIKADKLFSHVYRAHRKLICTKCKFFTELAQDFEIHVRGCCEEILNGTPYAKPFDDSQNDSDEGYLEMKLNPISFPSSMPAPVPMLPPLVLPDPSRVYHPHLPPEGSVSLMPLHNSISYCYPSPYQNGTEHLNAMANFKRESVPEATFTATDDAKPSTSGQCKVDIKPELASPVQSSSDSGVADVTSDHNDADTTCWHCGCEFANESSLQTHTELYHRDETQMSMTKKTSSDSNAQSKAKKFSCTICNFTSDKQKTIIEHMRYHTGEVLFCRAGLSCAFKTVCDSTLEKHVETEHNDSLVRCPHCGFHCTDKVSFIRHYRRCHHSTSCSSCKIIKHSLGSKNKELSFRQNKEDASNSDVIKPYLHHNPYSKKANAISPYAHCNAAMSKVAVAIPQSLQTSVEEIMGITSSQSILREHKPRKQSKPRKLLQIHSPPEMLPGSDICDMNSHTIKRENSFTANMTKLLKVAKIPPKNCRLGHLQPIYFKNNINFICHKFWIHLNRKFHCKRCNIKFQYKYQLLLHKRKLHETKMKLVPY